jgi:hypothetical protein
MPTGELAGSTLNVGLFAQAIKGKGFGSSHHCAPKPAEAQCARGLFLEQIVRGAAVDGRVGQMLLDPGDLALQGCYPLMELVDGKRTQVLLDELR